MGNNTLKEYRLVSQKVLQKFIGSTLSDLVLYWKTNEMPT